LQQLQEDREHAEQRSARGNDSRSIVRGAGAIVGRSVVCSSVFASSVVGRTSAEQRGQCPDHREHADLGCAAGVPNPR
jgi:hypothetical protein